MAPILPSPRLLCEDAADHEDSDAAGGTHVGGQQPLQGERVPMQHDASLGKRAASTPLSTPEGSSLPRPPAEPSAAPRIRPSATLTLPDSIGGGIAYKRTVIAELNKLRPGQSLPVDRVAKVRAAAKAMSDRGKSKESGGSAGDAAAAASPV